MNHPSPPSASRAEYTAYELADLIADYTPEEIYGPDPTTIDSEEPPSTDDTPWSDLPWHDTPPPTEHQVSQQRRVPRVPPDIPGIGDWQPLARGGFATVWSARQLTLDRPVAVKVDERTLDSDVERRRFLGEAKAAGNLSGHPGIVTVHDAGFLPTAVLTWS